MVKKKVVELKESWDDVESSDSKLNPGKSVGKSLLARLKKFKEKGREWLTRIHSTEDYDTHQKPPEHEHAN